MIVALDETGDFIDAAGEKYGMVTLVSWTDKEFDSFKKEMSKLLGSEWHINKGQTISLDDRTKVIRYVGRRPEIRYTTLLYNIEPDNSFSIRKQQNEAVFKIRHRLAGQLDAPADIVEKIDLLSNQLEGLSVTDYVKFHLIIVLYHQWIAAFALDYSHTHLSRDGWRIKYTIDTQTKSARFLQMVQLFLKLNMHQANFTYSMVLPIEWGLDHPFLKNHVVKDLEDRIKLSFDDMVIGREQDHPELFLPDLIGNTIFRSINRQDDTRWLRLLKKLKPNRSHAITVDKEATENYYYDIHKLGSKDEVSDAIIKIVEDHARKMMML